MNDNKNHAAEMAKLVAAAATALDAVNRYWDENKLPGDYVTSKAGPPFGLSVDEQAAEMRGWAEELGERANQQEQVQQGNEVVDDEWGPEDPDGHRPYSQQSVDRDLGRIRDYASAVMDDAATGEPRDVRLAQWFRLLDAYLTAGGVLPSDWATRA